MLNEPPRTTARVEPPPPPPSLGHAKTEAIEAQTATPHPAAGRAAAAAAAVPPSPSSRRKWSDGPQASKPIATEGGDDGAAAADDAKHKPNGLKTAPLNAATRAAWMAGASASVPRSPRRRWGDSRPTGSGEGAKFAFSPAIHQRPETPDDADAQTDAQAQNGREEDKAASDAAAAESEAVAAAAVAPTSALAALVDLVLGSSSPPTRDAVAAVGSARSKDAHDLAMEDWVHEVSANTASAAPSTVEPSAPASAPGSVVDAAYAPYTAPVTPRSSRRARWYLEKGWDVEIPVALQQKGAAPAPAQAPTKDAAPAVKQIVPPPLAVKEDTPLPASPVADQIHECKVCFKRFAMPESLKAHEWVHNAVVRPRKSSRVAAVKKQSELYKKKKAAAPKTTVVVEKQAEVRQEPAKTLSEEVVQKVAATVATPELSPAAEKKLVTAAVLEAEEVEKEAAQVEPAKALSEEMTEKVEATVATPEPTPAAEVEKEAAKEEPPKALSEEITEKVEATVAPPEPTPAAEVEKEAAQVEPAKALSEEITEKVEATVATPEPTPAAETKLVTTTVLDEDTVVATRPATSPIPKTPPSSAIVSKTLVSDLPVITTPAQLLERGDTPPNSAMETTTYSPLMASPPKLAVNTPVVESPLIKGMTLKPKAESDLSSPPHAIMETTTYSPLMASPTKAAAGALTFDSPLVKSTTLKPNPESVLLSPPNAVVETTAYSPLMASPTKAAVNTPTFESKLIKSTTLKPKAESELLSPPPPSLSPPPALEEDEEENASAPERKAAEDNSDDKHEATKETVAHSTVPSAVSLASTPPPAAVPAAETTTKTPPPAAVPAAVTMTRTPPPATAAFCKPKDTPPTPTTPPTHQPVVTRGGIAPLLVLPVIASFDPVENQLPPQEVGHTTFTHTVPASPQSARKNWCKTDAHRFQTIGILTQSPIRNPSPELIKARRTASMKPEPSAARSAHTQKAAQPASNESKSWSSSTKVSKKPAPISLALGEKLLLGSPSRSARKSSYSSINIGRRRHNSYNDGAGAAETTPERFKSKSKSKMGTSSSSTKAKGSTTKHRSSSASSPSMPRKHQTPSRSRADRSNLNETWPAQKPASPRRYEVSNAEVKASEMRSDFKSWLQWRKEDSKRADEVALEAQKVGADSHPDDFAFDSNGAPVFQPEKQQPHDPDILMWMQSVEDANESSENYKQRYMQARKKKLLSSFAPP